MENQSAILRIFSGISYHSAYKTYHSSYPKDIPNGSDRQRMTDLAKFITDSARTGNHKMTIFAAYYILYYI